MKFFILIISLSLPAFSQPLSQEDQKQLIEENSRLKKENQELKEELLKLQGQSADTSEMMKILQRGKKYQEDQLKALEELEKEL